MKPTDVRTKSDGELRESLVGLRKEAFNLRFQRAGGQLENTARVRGIRRDIARIKTVLTERHSTGASPAGPAPATTETKAKTKSKTKSAPAKKSKSAKSKAKSA